MTDRLLTAKDVAERYQCTLPSARKYMRQMEHMENPLRVTETALRVWEARRTQRPGETVKQQRQRVKLAQTTTGIMLIPRRTA